MNLMFRFSGDFPVVEVAIETCSLIMCCSCFSSLSMKSWVSSRITVTKLPVMDWFMRFLNSIFWEMRSTAAEAFCNKPELNLKVLRVSGTLLPLLSDLPEDDIWSKSRSEKLLDEILWRPIV